MKVNIILTITAMAILFFGFSHFKFGKVYSTRLNGNGCVCHSIEASENVIVWVEGPDSLFIGQTSSFTMYMVGGPAVAGGYNVAVKEGLLNISDSLSILIDNEITQSYPLQFQSGIVSWKFDYTAPINSGWDTIYSTGLSVNFNGIPDEDDLWAFGDDLPIKIVDSVTTSIDNNLLVPQKFVLYQNYPNPFNPVTNISFQLTVSGFVSLVIYDLQGKEIQIIFDNEWREAGYFNHSVSLNNSAASSGVYFYHLQVNEFSDVKKMVLLR